MPDQLNTEFSSPGLVLTFNIGFGAGGGGGSDAVVGAQRMS